MSVRILRPVPSSLATTHTSVDYLHECACVYTLSRQSDGRRSWQCHGSFLVPFCHPSFFLILFSPCLSRGSSRHFNLVVVRPKFMVVHPKALFWTFFSFSLLSFHSIFFPPPFISPLHLLISSGLLTVDRPHLCLVSSSLPGLPLRLFFNSSPSILFLLFFYCFFFASSFFYLQRTSYSLDTFSTFYYEYSFSCHVLLIANLQSSQSPLHPL